MKNVPCEYGREIKRKLLELGMNQTELIQKVKEQTGMYCDSALLSHIIMGTVKPTANHKIASAINQILCIEE